MTLKTPQLIQYSLIFTNLVETFSTYCFKAKYTSLIETTKTVLILFLFISLVIFIFFFYLNFLKDIVKKTAVIYRTKDSIYQSDNFLNIMKFFCLTHIN